MASSCNRFISRTSLSAIKSALKANGRTASVNRSATPTCSPFPLPSRSTVSPLRRFSSSRTKGELGCIQSLLPLHSAVAAARMTSCLSSTSRSCKALSQELCISHEDGYHQEIVKYVREKLTELGLSVPR